MFGYGIGRLLSEHGDKEHSWHIEHNRYLFIMSTSGLLTILPYILFIISLLWLSWKSLNRVRNYRAQENLTVGAFLLPVVLLFALQINNCGQERYYYWIFFGFIAAWIRNETMVINHENTSD